MLAHNFFFLGEHVIYFLVQFAGSNYFGQNLRVSMLGQLARDLAV